MVTDPVEAAATPERAVLSALAHGGGQDREPVLKALLVGLMKTEPDHARMYYDLVDEVLPEGASELLEALMTMTYEYQGRVARKYVAEGRAEGREAMAATLLGLLSARRVPVSVPDEERIMQCRDISELSAWVIRAATAGFCAEIFG